MTILRFALALAVFTLITSCGGDDDDITGTYSIYSYGVTGCDDPEDNLIIAVDDDGCTEVAGQEVCLIGSMTFNSDNTFSIGGTISAAGFSEELSGSGGYTISGNTVTICDEEECLDGTLNGNELTLSIPSEDGCVLTIKGRK